MMEATSVSTCANTLLICLHIRVPAGQMQQIVLQNRNCQRTVRETKVLAKQKTFTADEVDGLKQVDQLTEVGFYYKQQLIVDQSRSHVKVLKDGKLPT